MAGLLEIHYWDRYALQLSIGTHREELENPPFRPWSIDWDVSAPANPQRYRQKAASVSGTANPEPATMTETRTLV